MDERRLCTESADRFRDCSVDERSRDWVEKMRSAVVKGFFDDMTILLRSLAINSTA